MPSGRIISPDNDKSHVRMDLENAPEIAAELGHMCVAWAAVEWRVFAFYVAITGIPVALARRPWSGPGTPEDQKPALGLAIRPPAPIEAGSEAIESRQEGSPGFRRGLPKS